MAAGVRAGTGLCPRVGRPNFCTETVSLDGTGVPKRGAGVLVGTGQCPDVGRRNLLCRKTCRCRWDRTPKRDGRNGFLLLQAKGRVQDQTCE